MDSGLIHDTHLQHAGIYIHKRERCCHFGPNDTDKRLKMFHFLESPKVQGALRLLLLIDLVVVCFEIFFLFRALPPSFQPDTDAASLYTPQYSMCSLATTNAEFTTCCGEVEKEYGRFSPFSSIEDCKCTTYECIYARATTIKDFDNYCLQHLITMHYHVVTIFLAISDRT